MKKKFLFFGITALFAGSMLVSCAGETTDENAETTEEVATDEPVVAEEATADYSAGEALYSGAGTCTTCHGADGVGTPGVFPPLASSSFIASSTKEEIIKQTLYGATAPMTVNDAEYPGGVMGPTMAGVELTDQQFADIINYVMNSWGNSIGTVTAEEVAAQRN